MAHKFSTAGWLYNAGVVGLLRILRWAHRESVVSEVLEEGLKEEHLKCFELYYWAYATKEHLKSGNWGDILSDLKKLLPQDSKEYKELRAKLQKLIGGLKPPVCSENLQEAWEEFVKEVGKIFNVWLKEVESTVEERIRGKLKEELSPILGEEVAREISQTYSLSKGVEGLKDELLGTVNDKKARKQIEKLLKSLLKDEKSLSNFGKSITKLLEGIKSFKYAITYLKRFYFNKSVVGNYAGSKDRLGEFKSTYLQPALSVLSENLPSGKETFTCTFCGREYPLTKEWESILPFTEGDFSPLGVSEKQFPNYFYDGHPPYKCPVCQLILLTTFAGFNRKPWIMGSVDGTNYIFVDQPDLKSALRVNDSLAAEIWAKETGALTKENLYIRGLEEVIAIVKRKTSWVLQNTLFVELKVTTSKQGDRPHFVYFNVDRAFAEVMDYLKENNLIEGIKNALDTYYTFHDHLINLGVEVMKRLLNRQSLKPLIFPYFKDVLEGKGSRWALWWMVFLENLVFETRRELKKGGKKLSIGNTSKTLWALRKAGEESLRGIEYEKRLHLGQRFLSLVRGGRKEDFYNELLRLYVVYEEEVPPVLFRLLSEDRHLTFQEKALAFLTGFVSPKRAESESQKEEVSDAA